MRLFLAALTLVQLLGQIDPTTRTSTFKDAAGDPGKALPWPSFRGPSASGVADGQNPPHTWRLDKTNTNWWRTPLPGLGNSSPIIWGDRVFLTTAVSSAKKSEFKPGQYGAVTEARDRSRHSFRVYCLDRRTGKILWERTAHEGVPQVRRHIKSTHANATPATDGRHLIVSFASEGLFAFDLDGKPLWRRELGVLDAGYFDDPDIQWEAASSPILFEDTVIVQCDRQENSYVACFKVATGEPVWRTARDEQPSWGTPTVIHSKSGPELVCNGSNYVRGYDPRTGKQLWQLGRNSLITVPTPIAGDELIYVTSGYRPVQPIYAIRPGSRGNLTLKDRKESSASIAWSRSRGGPYMPTPLYYRGHLYVCSNSGVLTCYEGKTGEQIYRKSLGGGNGYTASAVAADGRLYYTSEDGQVQVIRAGPTFERLSTNELGATCLATPAISGGTLVFRTLDAVIGIHQ